MKFIQFVVSFSLFLLIFLPLLTVAQTSQSNFEIGIIPGNIWYSPFKFFAGDKIKIYTAVFNNSGYDISGTVVFFDNNQEIGQKDFFLAAKENIGAISIDWIAKEGKRKISVKLINLNKIIDGKKTYLPLEEREIAEAKLNIDSDNDGDGIGDSVDEDDDNDGIKDDIEKVNGLDPKINEADLLRKEFLTKIKNTHIISTSSSLIKRAISLTKKIDNYADQQKIKLEKIKQEKFYPQKVNLKQTSLRKASSSIAKAKIPNNFSFKNFDKYLNKLYYFILSLAIFILGHKLLLYVFLVIIVYNILKIIIRFFLD